MINRKKKFLRYLSAFMALNIFFQVVSPTVAMALTSGPSQPEVESFEPVSTTEMVDVFSGDFVYNIPLMNVPGPNGGYPINIAYHAGIGLDQEASWCGLGWNINPGVINRQMRGLPDDFAGKKVIKTQSHKPNITFGLALGPKQKEIVGFEPKPHDFNWQLYYNNYKGIGLNVGFQAATFQAKKGEKDTKKTKNKAKLKFFTLNVNFDNQGGVGLDPSVSFSKQVHAKNYILTGSVGYNSRHGITTLGLNAGRRKLEDKKAAIALPMLEKPIELSWSEEVSGSRPSGISFNGSSYTPSNSTGMYGWSAKVGLQLSKYLNPGFENFRSLSGSFAFQGVKDETLEFKGYGYNYSEKREEDPADKALMDFNRDKDFVVTQNTPALPMPVYTYDVYTIKGQGTGGSFRPYRGDIGMLYDPRITSDFGNGNVNLEVAFGTGTHVGGDGSVAYSHSYSGKWQNMWSNLSDYRFKPADNTLFEPFYYKAAGEMTAGDVTELDDETDRFGGNSLNKFRISMAYGGTSMKPKIHNETENNSTFLSYNKRNKRAKRVQGVEQKTFQEVKDNLNYASRAKHIYSGSDPNVWTESSSDYTAYDYSYDDANSRKPSKFQTAQITTVNPDGNRYEYGLPVFNFVQKDVTFSCDNAITTDDDYNTYTQRHTYYDSGDASTGNDDNGDNFFSSTELPAYTHSFMLTAIYSPDYVDITGDGPSKDDFGYYVKFNYTRPSASNDFKWRSPFLEADLNVGDYSNKKDDKGSYSYGEKEIYYTHSIETKTHVAVFVMSDRYDGMGVSDEYNTTVTGRSKTLKKLDKIELYSKKDLSTPIKTVRFEYSYELCKGVPNNSNTPTSGTLPSNSGKLTLTKIWFEYNGNAKGRLSPYIFDYNEDVPAENPDFHYGQTDRWGNYKPDNVVLGTGGGQNPITPYVDQTNRSNVNAYAAVWSLKKVTLPSGAEINVEYEADDYAYVQDKQAMQMFKIIGTGKDDSNDNSTNVLEGKVDTDHRRIYFDLKKDENGAPITDINKYIGNAKLIYFKSYMKLKNVPGTGEKARDYVEGFAEIDKSACGTLNIDGDLDLEGYISLKSVNVNKLGNAHPIAKASWEYMKNQRPDLLYGTGNVTDGQSIGLNFIQSVISMFRESLQMLIGYYRTCKTLKYGNAMDLGNADLPSMIRLYTPDKIKFGGGHRVKTLTINDKWNSMAGSDGTDFQYGQEYYYRMPDGTSSGVAEYEPLIGGDEIPHHLPSDKYKARDFIFASKDLYLIEPYGEAYFPSANVGYRRVLVKDIRRVEDGDEINTKTATGIKAYEFYTAKEFPVAVNKTSVTSKKYSPTISVIGIGVLDFDNKGYSQGYTIMLNDMHGKPRSISTHSYIEGDLSAVELSSPSTKTEYIYNTSGSYNGNKKNTLSSMVKVLYGDGNYKNAPLGLTSDFVLDMDQHSTFDIDGGLQANMDLNALPPVFIPSLWPIFNYTESLYRSVVNTKIFYMSGIPVQTNIYKDGAVTTTKNLAFDAETGQPLLTSVINDFDDPVYTYKYPVHWNYSDMGGSYQNYGFKISPLSSVSGTTTWVVGSTMAGFFRVGDQVTINTGSGYINAWVTSKPSSTELQLKKENGDVVNFNSSYLELKIVKSAATNQQSLISGNIVSLSDPATPNWPVLEGLNEAFDVAGGNPQNIGGDQVWTASFHNTCSGEDGTITLTDPKNDSPTCSDGTRTFTLKMTCGGTDKTVAFCLPMSVYPPNVRFYYNPADPNNSIIVRDISVAPAVDYTISFLGTNELFPGGCNELCRYQRILHADAIRLSNDWTYNYTELGDPLVDGVNHISSSTINDYRYGKKGIWRVLDNYVYQVDRLQADDAATKGKFETNIAKDGEYLKFTPFTNWTGTVPAFSDGQRWSVVSTKTKYHPFGFDLENRDALGIYSSALYGYNYSLATAVAANAQYQEIAFEGFEDHNGTTYTANGGGHLLMNTHTLNATEAHTGTKSLTLSSGGDKYTISGSTTDYFVPQLNKKYVVSAWFKKTSTQPPLIEILQGASNLVIGSIDYSSVVEGWQKVEVVFSVASLSTNVDVKFRYTSGATGYVDDIRIFPFNGAIKTYVYDPNTLWLKAELDNRNYATFYNYDEEGSLVQTKKETERGVMTITTNRNNIKRP